MNILIVCTGNTCRSPMAEALLANRLGSHSIRSAGVMVTDTRVSDNAVSAISSLDEGALDVIKNHVPTQISPEMIMENDLFVAMSPGHAGVLQSLGVSPDKIITLNVSDPYGGSIQQYEAVCAELDAAMDGLARDVIEGKYD